jgi:hypothetical protein
MIACYRREVVASSSDLAHGQRAEHFLHFVQRAYQGAGFGSGWSYWSLCYLLWACFSCSWDSVVVWHGGVVALHEFAADSPSGGKLHHRPKEVGPLLW